MHKPLVGRGQLIMLCSNLGPGLSCSNFTYYAFEHCSPITLNLLSIILSSYMLRNLMNRLLYIRVFQAYIIAVAIPKFISL